MTLLKDNNYKEINVALLSLEADIKNKIAGFDTSEIDKQLAEINSRIDKINDGSNNSSDEIEDINSKLNRNSNKIKNIEQNIEDIDTKIDGIEQKLSDIFSAENKVTDFNTTTNSGIYYWITDAANKPGTDYGVLLVNKYDRGDNNSIWINQVAYGTNNKIYFRQNINSGNWTEWKAVAFDGELNADTVDNYHASQLWRSDGATWNPNANVSLNATANGDEWSFDISRNGHTGCYWHVWDSSHSSLLKVNADDGKVSAPYGFVGNLSGKASTAGTADNANKLNSFAYWHNPYDYDATNGVRPYVYKITMPSWFSSILVQIYDDINYARSRKYFLGLWHVDNYGYNVSVTDLGGTKNNGLKVWFGNDGNVYLQADVYWTSRISFSYLDDVSDVTITKIGSARYGSNADINGNVLFTPLTDPITDCGALRADDRLSSVSMVPQILKTDILFVSNKLEASSKMIIPIGAPSSLEDGCIWIER